MPALSFVVVAVVAGAIVFLGLVVARSNEPDTGPCHSLPDHPFSCAEAHAVMQELINCDVESCDKKWAAWSVLCEAKKLVPSTPLRVAK